MYRNDIHIGDVFEYPVYGGLNLTLTVKIVGAYKPLKRYRSLLVPGAGRPDEHAAQSATRHFRTVLLKQTGKFQSIRQAGIMPSILKDIKTSQLSPLTEHAGPAQHRSLSDT